MQRQLQPVISPVSLMTATQQVDHYAPRSGQKVFAIVVWCFGLAIVLTGFMLGLQPLGALSLLAVPLAVTMWQTWPRITIFLVVLASFVNIVDWYPKVFGLNLKPELIFGSLGLGLVLVRVLTKKTRLKITFVGFCLLMWVIATALSAVNSADPIRSATLSVLILLATAPFFVMVNTVQSVKAFDFAFNVLFWIGVCEGVFGLVAWFVGQAIDFAPFANVGASGFYVTNGTWMETNIFGDFLVATTMLFVAKSVGRRLRCWFWSLAGICAVGVIISQTRGAWLSLAACLVLMPVVLALTKVLSSPRTLFKFFAAVIGLSVILSIILAIVIAATPDSEFLQRRVGTLGEIASDLTFSQRVNVNSIALSSFLNRENIILGSGAKGFQLAGFNVLGIGDDWIGNIFLGALYDGGLIGLLAFLLVIGVALWQGLRRARRITDPNLKVKLTALVMAGLAIVFTGQSNNHAWLSLVWIYFGLLVAGTNVAKERSAHMPTEAG